MPLSKSILASMVVHMSCLNYCTFAGPQHFMCQILEEMGHLEITGASRVLEASCSGEGEIMLSQA